MEEEPLEGSISKDSSRNNPKQNQQDSSSGNMPNENENENGNIPWLSQHVVFVQGDVHPLPKHPENFLSKFFPDRKESIDDPIKKSMPFVILILNVKHEDMVSILFPYTSEGNIQLGIFL